jgi:hypothetical protein
MVLLAELFKSSSSPVSMVALGAICVISSLLILYSKEKRSFYYAAFWVEAIPILWLGILVVLRSL